MVRRCARAALVVWAAAGAGTTQAVGPDVIVGDLATGNDIAEYGLDSTGQIAAYSFGTHSCNVGDAPLQWVASTNQHPVIAQNLYRLKDGRFEQVGMAWLKHGFCALNLGLCGTCQFTPCDSLGVGCSDPYSAGLNGQQGYLGPRSEVNATTGEFPYPFVLHPTGDNTTYARLQVKVSDIDPAQNPGATWFIEGHYVTQDDAAWGNAANNASWRRIHVNSIMDVVTNGSTVRRQPAITAWKFTDPEVRSVQIVIADEGGPGVHGHFWLSAKATDLGDGRWNYEYALFNLNSHRSARGFSVPLPSGVEITNAGFHDVDYHSGEPYSGADWPVTIAAGSISWATETFEQNPNANALRWSTLYNFRFDANAPPIDEGIVQIELFRPGTPASVSAAIVTPDPSVPICACPGDLDDNGAVNGDDSSAFVAMLLGAAPVDACAELASPHGVPLDQNDADAFVSILLDAVASSCP